MFSGMENRMGAVSKPPDNRVARLRINRVAKFTIFSITFVINMIETWFWCPYLCFRAWEIEWEQFWNRPIKRVATFGITGLPDHLLIHKQVPQRWFLAWLNAAQIVANCSLENEIFLGLLSDCSVLLCLCICMYVQHNTSTSIDLQSWKFKYSFLTRIPRKVFERFSKFCFFGSLIF